MSTWNTIGVYKITVEYYMADTDPQREDFAVSGASIAEAAIKAQKYMSAEAGDPSEWEIISIEFNNALIEEIDEGDSQNDS